MLDNLDFIGPQLSVLVGAGLIIGFDSVFPRQRRVIPFLALLALAFSIAYTTSWVSRDDYQAGFHDTLVLDQYAVFFFYLFAGITATVVLASIDWVRRDGRSESEYYALVLVTCAGLMFLASSRDLITIFIALEMSSIPQYVLAGWGKDSKSSEAGVKYLLLGAIASSLLLYGMALLYGATGTTLLSGISEYVSTEGEENRALLLLATTLIIAGFGFKMAVVPFQMWVPDVYQGAPTPVAAFLSVGSKAAAFAVVIRIFFEALDAEFLSDDWSMVFAILAAVSMTLGNVMAVVQTDIKRMLGYSSVAQAGTILIGVAAISASGEEFTLGAGAVLFFAGTYAFTNLGAFIAVIAISQKIGSDRIADYAGMWKRAPVLTVVLTLCLVSLTGIPPTAGFFAKLYIFHAGIRADLWWLVIIGVVNTIVSGFYYLGVVRQMFASPAQSDEPVPATVPIMIALGVATAGVIAFGIFPSPLMEAAREAASVFAR